SDRTNPTTNASRCEACSGRSATAVATRNSVVAGLQTYSTRRATTAADTAIQSPAANSPATPSRARAAAVTTRRASPERSVPSDRPPARDGHEHQPEREEQRRAGDTRRREPSALHGRLW